MGRKVKIQVLPWQAEMLASNARTIVSIGGVGSGKSFGACYCFVKEILQFPKCRPYVVGPTFSNLKEGALHTLKSCLDEFEIEYEQNRSDLSITITSGRAKGTRIIAWTAEAYRRLKGQELDIVFADEAQTWERGGEVYNFLLTRMRASPGATKHHPEHKPRMWVAANPPHSTSHWLYQYFVKKNPADTRVFRSTTFDNYLLDDREAYIERMRSIMDPDMFKIEVMGEWGDLGVGRAYTQFDQRKHVNALPPGIDMSYIDADPIIVANDFGVDPRVGVICQVRSVNAEGYQKQVIVVLDEIRIRDGSNEEFVQEFARRYSATVMIGGSTAKRHVLLYGDPAGQARSSQTGISDWAHMTNHPLMKLYRGETHRKPAAPLIKDRIAAVNSKLVNARQEIGVIIHPRCQYTIDDLQGTRWKEGTTALDKGTPAKGILRTHLSDALGYFVDYEWPVNISTFKVVGSGASTR